MTPAQLCDALAALRWSRRGLAEALGCDDRLVRRWASGEANIPPDIAVWLFELAEAHQTKPPPQTWRTRRLAAEM